MKLHRIVLFDFPGFGQSDKPADYSYSLFEQADVALEVWRSLGVSGGHLLGHDQDFAGEFFGVKSAVISCPYPVNFELHSSYAQGDPWHEEHDIPRPRDWPAFILDLIPQGFGRRSLAKKMNLSPGPDAADWALLLEGAGNPVGNVRIRSPAGNHGSGRSRSRYYSKPEPAD